MTLDERRGICCSGNWIIDHVKTIDLWPPEESIAYILDQELSTGGAAANVGFSLARFKLPLSIQGLGVVGDDPDGDYILGECKRYGVDDRLIRKVSGVPTSYTDVMNVRGSGRRTFFHNRGANALLSAEHFPVEELKCRILSLGYLLLLDTLDREDPEYGTEAARVLARVHETGILTAVDLVSECSDRFSRIVPPALRHTDYLIVNEFEAGRTTGKDIGTGDTLNRDAMVSAAEVLLSHGVNKLVVIHTPEVAFGLSRDGERVWTPSLDVPADFIQGTVGAGDAFFAGMLVGIHENWDLARSLTFANAAAATCLCHPTCTGGVGTAEDIWKLSESFPLKGCMQRR